MQIKVAHHFQVYKHLITVMQEVVIWRMKKQSSDTERV